MCRYTTLWNTNHTLWQTPIVCTVCSLWNGPVGGAFPPLTINRYSTCCQIFPIIVGKTGNKLPQGWLCRTRNIVAGNLNLIRHNNLRIARYQRNNKSVNIYSTGLIRQSTKKGWHLLIRYYPSEQRFPSSSSLINVIYLHKMAQCMNNHSWSKNCIKSFFLEKNVK